MSEEEVLILRHGAENQVSTSEYGVTIRREGKPVHGTTACAGYVYLLLDCSASMAGNKLEQGKQGTVEFSNNARAKGYLAGLIVFQSRACHVCDPMRDLSTLQRELERVKTGGGTNMAGAIRMAADRLAMKTGTRVIVIATDGVPDSVRSALREAQRAKEAGIEIATIGTDDADTSFLRELASEFDLGIKVSKEQFCQGITSMSTMLPQLSPGQGEK